MSIILTILTVLLIGVALFLILVVLAQKAKDGGMGAAMGGGMAEAAFGADTGNVLSKATINAAIAFFVLAFALYLGRIYQRTHAAPAAGALPTIAVPVTPAAAPTAPATTTATPTAADTKAVPTPTKPADQTPKKP
ncbi:MAG: preprotein translocase subunit SecG [Verrucomicrobia bacterium]|nr:preprotein translocase subunit SecG [Verrucomicrobiota bacterium]